VDVTVSAAAVICAAGSSSRMGGLKKEYQKLKDGITVLGSSVRALAVIPHIKTIVISIPQGSEADARDALPPEYMSAQFPKILFVTGGSTRRESVFNALSCLESYNPDYVLIHDGARPWVSASLIENLIKAVIEYNAVIPLQPLTDTPKECDEQGSFVKNHLKRSSTGIAQTPQAFKFSDIHKAHEKAAIANDEEFTDDAEIWGRFCGQVAVIPGDPSNKKITFLEDLV